MQHATAGAARITICRRPPRPSICGHRSPALPAASPRLRQHTTHRLQQHAGSQQRGQLLQARVVSRLAYQAYTFAERLPAAVATLVDNTVSTLIDRHRWVAYLLIFVFVVSVSGLALQVSALDMMDMEATHDAAEGLAAGASEWLGRQSEGDFLSAFPLLEDLADATFAILDLVVWGWIGRLSWLAHVQLLRSFQQVPTATGGSQATAPGATGALGRNGDGSTGGSTGSGVAIGDAAENPSGASSNSSDGQAGGSRHNNPAWGDSSSSSGCSPSTSAAAASAAAGVGAGATRAAHTSASSNKASSRGSSSSAGTGTGDGNTEAGPDEAAITSSGEQPPAHPQPPDHRQVPQEQPSSAAPLAQQQQQQTAMQPPQAPPLCKPSAVPPGVQQQQQQTNTHGQGQGQGCTNPQGQQQVLPAKFWYCTLAARFLLLMNIDTVAILLRNFSAMYWGFLLGQYRTAILALGPAELAARVVPLFVVDVLLWLLQDLFDGLLVSGVNAVMSAVALVVLYEFVVRVRRGGLGDYTLGGIST